MNFLLLIADDLRPDLGCYGHHLAVTPHIDRLATRGVTFDRAYCQFALCNPSRASLFTGRRPESVGVLDLKAHFRDTVPDVVTLTQRLREAGYFTARAGKVYHMGVPDTICTGGDGHDDPASWDERVNCPCRELNSNGPYYNATPWEKTGAGTGGAIAWLEAVKPDAQQHDHKVATAIADRIAARADADRPWMLAAGFARPHVPLIAPQRWFDHYRDAEVELPASRADHDALAQGFRDAFGGGFDLSDDDHRDAIRAYLACVSFLDEQVGRVLDALEASGEADDTVVVLTADHGFLLGEHGLWFKKFLYEPSCRVPLFIADPRRPAGHGRHHGDPVELLDLYPTLAELLGVEAPDGLEGESLVPQLDSPAADTGRAAVTTVRLDGRRGVSLRTRRHRYTTWDDPALPDELYDHDRDPAERRNVADRPGERAVIDRLREHLPHAAARDATTPGRGGP